MTQVQGLEIALENEKSAKYRGVARIRLEWLHFRNKQLNHKHVRKLQSIFRKDCRRLDARNRIVAVIDQQHLEAALQISQISEGLLPTNSQDELPELGFWTGFELECLDGLHRIEAAKQALTPRDMWWTVDLYRLDISAELKQALAEGYANEHRASDGEIYRKIREYHSQSQFSLETREWNRLSSHGARNLKQLFRHQELAAAFDCFLEIPALLEGMRISVLHKMIAIRCDEEVLRYLRHIKGFWSTLLRQDMTAMQRVDQATVKALELTAPWASTSDAQILRCQVLGGGIFQAFNQPEREEIWNRLQSFEGLVPSLYGFFEDIKLLEACANCLNWVVQRDARDTVSAALKKIHTGASQESGLAVVQETETTFKRVSADLAYQTDLGCRQLWAFALRYYREVPKKPSGKNLLAKPTATVDMTKLGQIADLADRLGFESSEITALMEYPSSADSDVVTVKNKPVLVTVGPGETKKERCGMPRTQSYYSDRKFLFITHLHDDRSDQSDGITSFFRIRSFYSNFFGIPGYRTIDHINISQHLIQTGGSMPQPSYWPSSAYLPREDEPEQVDLDMGEDEVDPNQTMGESEEQRPSLEAQEVVVQESVMQEQQQENLLSNANILHKQEQEQEIYRQNLSLAASALQGQEQEHKQRREKILSHAHELEKQEKEQEQHRQKLADDASAAEQQELELREQREKLSSEVDRYQEEVSRLQEREQEKEQRRGRVLSHALELERQEQEQKQRRQKLAEDADRLERQNQDLERQKEKLAVDASALKKGEQERGQKLTADAKEEERGREKERETLAREEDHLINQRRKLEEQQQMLTEVADKLREQEKGQEEQRQSLANCASDLKKQELEQSEHRGQLRANIEEQAKRKIRSKLKATRGQVEEKEGKPDESGTSLERDELDTGELQRQGKQELADLEFLSPPELELGGADPGQSTTNFRAESCSPVLRPESGAQRVVSAAEGESIPVDDKGIHCDGTQDDRHGQSETRQAQDQENIPYGAGVRERGQENAVQDNGREDGRQKEGYKDRAHGDGAREEREPRDEVSEDTAGGDRAQASGQADTAQEVLQTDEASKDGPDSGAYEFDGRERRAGKRRTDQSDDDAALQVRERRNPVDDGAALRALKVREGRNPLDNGKYQRLDRFKSSNHDMNPEERMSVDGTGKPSPTPQSRQNLL